MKLLYTSGLITQKLCISAEMKWNEARDLANRPRNAIKTRRFENKSGVWNDALMVKR